MKSYIKSIIIFNKQGEKRNVELKQGVNVITGESKTGKSALIEIIDYCLCSTRCTIPKGKITEFGYIYCILFVINDKCAVIGRKSWDENRNKMFINWEKSDISSEDINITYFEDSRFRKIDYVKFLIETELGLNVTDISEDADEKKKGKASLRNIVSYLFQHQNLMASKFALFYRFDDFYKRQSTIDQFPVFAGLVDQEYYSTKLKLDDKQKKLRQAMKQTVKNEDIKKALQAKLKMLYQNYFALIGKKIDCGETLKELIELKEKLPIFDVNSYGSDEYIKRYNLLEQELEKLYLEKNNVMRKITSIQNTKNSGNNYAEILKELKHKTELSKPEREKYSCPICGNENIKINQKINDIAKSEKWLNIELKNIQHQTFSFDEEVRILEDKKTVIMKNINDLTKEVKALERDFIQLGQTKTLQNNVLYAKAKIDVTIDTINKGIFEDIDEEIEDLKAEINDLKKKIKGYDLVTKIEEAKIYIKNNMNRLAEKLDFEEEFRPVNLIFDLSNFELYHNNKKENIYLSEMGSGANWVSCHISLFLSLLSYFCSRKDKSSIPSLLFFDQPSQVYFPQYTAQPLKGQVIDNKKIDQVDIEAVNKIYVTIIEEVENIAKNSEILPQVIITDHVGKLELDGKYTFKNYIRKDWRNGQGLI